MMTVNIVVENPDEAEKPQEGRHPDAKPRWAFWKRRETRQNDDTAQEDLEENSRS